MKKLRFILPSLAAIITFICISINYPSSFGYWGYAFLSIVIGLSVYMILLIIAIFKEND